MARLLRRRSPAPVVPTGDRVLVAGWFSFAEGHATAGDLRARDVACRWLGEQGRAYDVANAPGFGAGVDWRSVDPARYAEVLFVCGPVGPDTPILDLLGRFAGSTAIGLGVSLIDGWNPFDVIIERDSPSRARPDLAYAAAGERLPLVGVVLVEPYPPEYPGRDRQDDARAAALATVAARRVVRVPIDTRLDVNAGDLREADEVESLIARMDAVVTTRLHGMVLALKHGVPALAIDVVAGGAKLNAQAGVVGWPVVRTADALDAGDLEAALDFCLTPEARALAAGCAERAGTLLDDVREELRRATVRA